MKLDTESIYAHSTLASKPDLQISDYDDTTVETARKVNNDIPVEKMKVLSDPDVEKHETVTNSLHTPDKIEELKNTPTPRSLDTMGTSVSGRKENDDPFYSNSINLIEDETEFYTDKNVTELELPKMPDSFKDAGDGDYNAVKDICIDDGFPSLDRNLVENDEIQSKVTFNSMHLDLDVDNVLPKVNMENPVPILNETNPFIEIKSKADVTNDYSYETLNRNSEEDKDENANADSVVSSVFSRTNPFLECDSDSDSELDYPKNSFPENFKLDYETSADKSYDGDVDRETPILTGANPFLESGSESNVSERSFHEGLVGKGEEDSDATVNLASDEKISHETLHWMPEFDVSSSRELSISVQEQSDQGKSSSEGSAESIMPSAEETIDDTDREAHSASSLPSIVEETNNNTSGEAHSQDLVLPSTAMETNEHTSRVGHSTSSMPSTAEERDDDTSREAHSAKSILPSTAEESNQFQEEHLNNQVQTGSITDNVDSSPPETCGKEEDLKSKEGQPANETLSLPSIGEDTVDSRTASSRSFFIQHGYGETSFSTTGPFSGPIPSSGPMSYSGSTSLRSDSSTTSARSFAFPVLNTDWISSPVKMAKPDRKHIRKQRGWLLSLLCCRF